MERSFGRVPRTQVTGIGDNPMAFNGLWDAVVVSVRDPDKRGRVLVRVYDVHDETTPEQDLPWAEPCFPAVMTDTGADQDAKDHNGGFFQVPPVGSQVYVMFRKGDPEFPVWMGCFSPKAPVIGGREGYQNHQRRDALYNADGVPTCPTWGSIGGHRVELDDDAQEMRLTTPGGMKLTMSDVSGNEHGEAIKLEDNKGNYVWLDTGSSRLTIKWDGDVVEDISGDRHTTVGGNWNQHVKGDMSLQVDGTIHSKSATHNIDTDQLLNLNCSKATPTDPNVAEQGTSTSSAVGVLEKLGNQIRKIAIGDG